MREYLERRELELLLRIQLSGYGEWISVRQLKNILHFRSVDAVKEALYKKHLVFSSVPIRKTEIVSYITEQYLKIK